MIESDASAGGAPPPMVDPLLGRVLNERFKIVEALGAGGMGRVYKAIQSPLDRMVALKILNPQYGQDKDPGFQRRFFLEANVTAKLRHPNTITIIDYGKTDDGIYYIAMEYLEGLTLSQLITQTGPLPWPRALSIAQQIARSLREAHKVGLIHRDLKPANVMILNQEKDHDLVKVLDFGLVKSFLPDGGNFPADVSLTQAGVILGSPQYMAPEQARNISDPRSDVYSLGVVLFQMLLGRPPFLAEQSIDIIVKHLNEPPPTFASIWPNHTIPPEVEALVMKCLAKRPAERFDSMDRVLDSIRRATAAAGLSSGFYSGPRSFVTPGSGPHTGPLPPQPSPSNASTMALDISVEEPQTKGRRNSLAIALLGGSVLAGVAVSLVFALSTPSSKSSPAPALPPPSLATAPPGPSAGAPSEAEPLDDLAVSLTAEKAAAPASPQEAAPEKPPLEEPAPEAAAAQASLVRFFIASEPSGARVKHRGKDLGVTPVELRLPANDAGRASAELTFELSGYPRSTVKAEGEGPEVRFTHKLKKKKSPSRQRPSGSTGYKDDPYQ
ncbi:serine/threonine-protein kinase [Stigmatella sp. ncwal1]|uniref:Serine/threonine-protein kinase n=1 Tax=Stigmatella ashevillensis TaxID=2995309 RepID=A0ABT5D930_9BACT|nr:serine/threonine-protein kinase [Stigmatella ashevillena]MDC0710076.1 serine/threonine-protein kinase [Stigmatella ashevillena]